MTLDYWSSLLITYLWTFIKGIKNHCNQIMYGDTGEEVAMWIMNNLQEQVRQHYQQFKEDTNYVLAQHQTLFTKRTLSQRLNHMYDHL